MLAGLPAALLLTGCVPWPGLSPRTPQWSGRVLSAATHRPLADARVIVTERPRLRSTVTDREGRFVLRETHNFHLFATIGAHGGPVDLLSDPWRSIEVSHPGYTSQRLDADDAVNSQSATETRILLKDILLRPLKTR